MSLARINVLPYNSGRLMNPYLSARTSTSGFPWSKPGDSAAFVNLFGKKKRKKRRSKKGRKHVGYCLKGGRIVRVYKVLNKSGTKYLKGRVYSNGRKVRKGTKCSRTKSKLQRRLAKRRKKRDRLYIIYYRNGKRYRKKRTYHTKAPKGSIRNDQLRLLRRKGARNITVGRKRCSQLGYTACTTLPHRARCEWTGSSCRSIPRSGFGRINPTSRYNYQMQQWATNAGTPTQGNMNRLSGMAAYSYPTQGRNYHFYKQTNNTSGYGF